MKRIVVIGGGTGTFTVLRGLRDYPFDISAIVSTADDGGSTGILVDELGVLPPGDLRQALVALSSESTVLRDLINYRFEEGSLKGHNFGNLLLSALEKVTGKFDQAVLEAGRILSIKGTVLPVTTDHMRLRAETDDGSLVNGEHAIEEHIWAELSHVTRLWLEPPCKIHPLAEQAILKADLIIIAPGSIFTSLIPNLLVDGMREALAKTKAKMVYVSNLMTEKGQTDAFTVQDFAALIQEYLGERTLDYVIYNNRLPDKNLLDRYKKEMERIPVVLNRTKKKTPYKLIGASLVQAQEKSASNADQLAHMRTLIRHNSLKLANIINALLFLEEAKRYLK